MAEELSERKRYYFDCDQLIAIGAAFAITLLSIFILGIVAGRRFEQGMKAEYAAAAAKTPPKAQSARIDADREMRPHEIPTVEKRSPEPAPLPSSDVRTARELKAKERVTETESAKPAVLVENGPKSTSPPSAAKSTDEAASLPASEAKRQVSKAPSTQSLERVWTVQIKSSSEKKFADNWANRLRAKGYDAFVVDADVKGQTWYRVRVGHFVAREEAEALRAALESKEGLSGSFLTAQEPADRLPAK